MDICPLGTYKRIRVLRMGASEKIPLPCLTAKQKETVKSYLYESSCGCSHYRLMFQFFQGQVYLLLQLLTFLL